MAMADQRSGAADQEEEEKEKMQGKQDQAFTIRGFVAAMREKDITKCWPFTPTQLQASMKESSGVKYYSYGDPGAVSNGDSASINQESTVKERLRVAQQTLLPPFYPPVSNNKKLDLNESFFTSGTLSSSNHNSKNPCNDEYRDNDDDDDRSLQFLHGSIQVQIELLRKAGSTDYYYNDHHQTNHIVSFRSQSGQTATCLPKKIKTKTVPNMGCKDDHHEKITRSNLSHHFYGESSQSHHVITNPSSFHNIMNPGPTLQSHQSIREIRQSIIDQGCRCCSEEPDMVTAASTSTIRGPWYGHDDAVINVADPHNINVIHSSPQTSYALSMSMMPPDSCVSINGVHDESCLIHDGGTILPTDQSTSTAVKGHKAFVNMPSNMGQMSKPMFNTVDHHSSPLTYRTVNSNKIIRDDHQPSSDQYRGINHNPCSKILPTVDHPRLITSHAAADHEVNDCINKDSAASSILKLAVISSPVTQRASVLDTQEENEGYVHINLRESHVSAPDDNINCDIKSNDSDASEDGKKVCAQGSAHDGIMDSAKAANSKLQKLGYDQSAICEEFGIRAVGITKDRQDGTNANSKSSIEISVYDPHIEEPMIPPSNNADSNSALTSCRKTDLQVCNNAVKSSTTPLSVVHVNTPTSTASRPVVHNDQVLVTTNNNNAVGNSIFAIQKCPICLHFQASSNTALNAHIDHCLASSSTNQSRSSNDQITNVNHVQVDLVDHCMKASSLKDSSKSSTLASKVTGKPRKIKSRSIAELCSVNDYPMPGAVSSSRISVGTITDSSNHSNKNSQLCEHDASGGSNHNNSNHELQMDGYHDEDPVMMCQKSAMQLGDEKVFDGTMASQSSNFRHGKRSKVGTGRIATRSSSTFHHDDGDGNNDQIMRGHQSRPHQVLKLIKQPQMQPKQNLTESSSSSTKTPKTNSPEVLMTALPSMDKPQDQSSRHVTKSVNPSGTSALHQQHRSKNITNIINNHDHDGRGRRSCKSNVSAGSSKDKTRNAELLAEVQNRLPASRKVTGMKLRSKSCKKTMTRKFGQFYPNESETANGSDCPVQGSYMPLQAIRADVLSAADIQTPKPSSDNIDNVNSMPTGKINAGGMQPELDDGAYIICSNQKDANQSLSIEQEIFADQQSFAPAVSIINKTVVEGQDEVIDIPETGVLDPQASEAISQKVVVQPDNLQPLDHGSEASECSRSVNQAALPANSSTDVGPEADEAVQRHNSSHDYQMSNICSSTNFTGCNASSLDDSAVLASGSDQVSQLPPINLEELHPSCCDQTTSNGQINYDKESSNSDQFTSHALPVHGVLRSSITTALEQPQGNPESTNFLSSSSTHIPDINNGFQYVAASNDQQAVGNIKQNNGLPIYDLEDQAVKSINQKNSVPIYDLEDQAVKSINQKNSVPIYDLQEDQFRTLVVVNVIQPVQANGMTNISTGPTSTGYLQGPARADLIMTPTVRHSQHPNFNHGTHFPNQRSSGSVLPTSSIPVYSQLQSGGQPITKSTLGQEAKSGFPRSLPPWMEAAIKIDSTSAAAAAFPPGNMSAHNCSTYASDMRSQHLTEQYSDASRVFQAVNGKPINLRLMGKTMVLTPAGGSNNPAQVDSTSCVRNWYDNQGSNQEYFSFTQRITAGSKVPYNTDQLRAQIINTKSQQEAGNSLQLGGSVGMRTLVSSNAHDSRASVLQSWSTNPAVQLPPACHTFDQTMGQRTQLGSSSSIGLQDNVAAQYASKVIKPYLQPSDSSFQKNAGSGYMHNTGHDNRDGHDEVSAYLYPIYPSHEYMMHPAVSTRIKSSSTDTTKIDDAYLCLQQQMLKDRNSSIRHIHPSPAPAPNSYYNQNSEACQAAPQPGAVSYNNAQQYIGHDIQPHQQGSASINKPSFNASVETQGSAILNNIPYITVNNNGVDGHITTNCDLYIPPCWKPNADKKQNKPHPQQCVEEIIIDEAEHVTNINRSVPRLFGQDLNPMGVSDRHQNITHGSAHPGQISQTLMQPGRSIPSMNQVQISTCGALEPQWSTIIRAPIAGQQEQVNATPAVQYFIRPGAAHEINYGTVINPKKRAANYQGGPYTVSSVGISNYGGSLGSRKRSRMIKRNQQVLMLPDSRVNAVGTATDSTSYEQFVVVQRRPFTNDSSTPCSYVTVKQKSKSRNNNSSPNSVRSNRDMISALGTSPCVHGDSQAKNMKLSAQANLYTSFDGTMPKHKVLPVQLTSELAANTGLEGSFIEKCSVNMNPAEVVDFHDASQFHVYPAR